MRIAIAITFLVACIPAMAQVLIDNSIVLIGTNDGDRQVHGLPDSTGASAMINAATELSNAHRSAAPASGTLWQIDLPSLQQAPVAGTQLIVHAPAPVPGPLQISINGNGPYAITRGPDETIDGATIPEGTMLSLVFDGNAMQLMNSIGRSLLECPAGTVAVNDQFCVQTERSGELLEFFEAIEHCGAMGMRLCTWGEYYSACIDAVALSIADMPNGWEWTNQSANENMSVRVVGSSSCMNAATSPATGYPRHFRCCLSR